MSKQDLFNDLKKIIEEVKEEEFKDLKIDTPLLEGLLDSFDLVYLITTIEDRFQISLSNEDLKEENFYSIKAISFLINDKLI
tara:strand:- start:717 stop:962 length:246 start_codon:yes stop_codon:yes gene_type:complete